MMRLEDMKIGDMIAIDYSGVGRGVVHYVAIEIGGNKRLSAYFGDVNGGDRPAGWLSCSGAIPGGALAIVRPKFAGTAFSRDYFGGEFDVLFESPDARAKLK